MQFVRILCTRVFEHVNRNSPRINNIEPNMQKHVNFRVHMYTHFLISAANAIPSALSSPLVATFGRGEGGFEDNEVRNSMHWPL